MLTFVTLRVIHSLINRRVEGIEDINFKFATRINLVKKVFNNVAEETQVNFTPWMFKETVVHANFFGIKYKFVCPPRCDSNIFLNPYHHEYDVLLLVSTILEKSAISRIVGAGNP
ncbi:MAG: hypothetical protein QXE05_00880 [Nitrososphaeria archaeon]